MDAQKADDMNGDAPQTMDRIRLAADVLARCRRDGRTIDRLPEACRPWTVAEAFLIQREVAVRLDVTSIGWKVSPFGEGSAVAAPIFASDIHPSPWEATGVTDMEGEIVFLLAHDLPHRPGEPYSREDICAAISNYALGFELIRARIASPEASYEERLADCLVNFGLVIGTQRDFTGESCLPQDRVALSVNGEERAYTPKPIDPVGIVQLYANAGGDAFGGLRAGQWVITGALTGMVPAGPGEAWHAELDGLSVSFENLGSGA
ncbi:hypothetical protein [Breoghania sp. L-A4]|uniref:hypothetical protein n=1 Tax=Breoghania sp. L-A4 TaxID=2304600 RepID=UPI000E35D007|nr:hypothetical protein [Breoghania sp. L-A4]AXS42174.1 hypothetical protein D1F64_21935 [Breoghania sp. L-A4]